MAPIEPRRRLVLRIDYQRKRRGIGAMTKPALTARWR
jgi:hypothetical protein